MKPGFWCDGNLVRLRRSLEKITYGLGPDHFSEADWHGLLDGYRQPGGMPGAPRRTASSQPNATSTNRVLNVASDYVPPPASAAPEEVRTPQSAPAAQA
jgi:hypothetical protein